MYKPMQISTNQKKNKTYVCKCAYYFHESYRWRSASVDRRQAAFHQVARNLLLKEQTQQTDKNSVQ